MKISYIFSSLFPILILVGCGVPEQKEAGADMQKVIVINVLDPELYNDCHLKGSINIPFDDFSNQAATLDKNAEIIVHCSNYACTASEYAAKELQKLGFENVWVYQGGTAEWYQQSLPVEGPCTSSYLQKVMHPVDHAEDASSIPTITIQELAQKLGYTI